MRKSMRPSFRALILSPIVAPALALMLAGCDSPADTKPQPVAEPPQAVEATNQMENFMKTQGKTPKK